MSFAVARWRFAPSRPAAAVAVCVLTLLWAPLYNGYPLVFPDTGTYVRQALEFYGSLDRPPYYGLALAASNWSVSLWLSAVWQNLLIASLIFAVIVRTCPDRQRIAALLILVGLLAATTALPWVSGQIMPDIWTGALVLLVFLRNSMREAPGVWGRTGSIAAIAAVTALHYGNLPLLVALVGVSAALAVFNSRRLSAAVPLLVDGAACVGLVVAAFITYSLAVVGQVKLSPMGSVFFSARLVADGTARPYLEKECPLRPTPFCVSLERPNLTSDEILWSKDSYLSQYHDVMVMERDAAALVRGTLAINAFGVAAASLRHTAAQLIAFRSFDTECLKSCGPDSSVWLSIAKHYPADFAAFRASRQIAGSLPQWLASVHFAVAWGSLALLPVVFAWCVVSKRREFAALIVLVAAGLIANAAIVGTLSAVHDRYQSRMIWLAPMIVILAAVQVHGVWTGAGRAKRQAS